MGFERARDWAAVLEAPPAVLKVQSGPRWHKASRRNASGGSTYKAITRERLEQQAWASKPGRHRRSDSEVGTKEQGEGGSIRDPRLMETVGERNEKGAVGPGLQSNRARQGSPGSWLSRCGDGALDRRGRSEPRSRIPLALVQT
jgi:hypothetical protein